MPEISTSFVLTVPIFTSSGLDTVAGIATASMTPIFYSPASANATNSLFSAGGGLYGLSVEDADNTGQHMILKVIVSATAANGFVSWTNALTSAALTNYNAASVGDITSLNNISIADVSTAVSAALTNYNVASAGDITGGLTSAAISANMENVLTVHDVATSADVSVIVAAGPALNSAATSIIAAQALSDYGGANLTEPSGAPTWAAMTRDVAISWLTARATNRHRYARHSSRDSSHNC